MTTQQMYQLVNSVLPSVLGQDDIQVSDVSSLGTVGKLIANMDKGYELFHGKILDRMIAVLQDNEAFELENIPFLAKPELFGGFWEEIYFDMPTAQETTSWNVGDPNFEPSLPGVTKLPLTVKAYGKEVITQSYEYTLPDMLLLSAFASNEGLSTYISGVATTVENRVKLDILDLARLVRAKYLATIINTPNTESVIDIVGMYMEAYPDDENVYEGKWKTNKNFLRFLAETMASYEPRLTKNPTSHYINEKTANDTDYVRQCTKDNLVFEVLSDVIRKIRFNLESDVFNPEKLNFGAYNEVQYWVQSGDDTLEDYSTISVKLGENADKQDITVTQKGIVGIMYDKRSIIETYRDPYRWAFRNQKARYLTYGIETNLGYSMKFSYPCVIFVVNDTKPTP